MGVRRRLGLAACLGIVGLAACRYHGADVNDGPAAPTVDAPTPTADAGPDASTTADFDRDGIVDALDNCPTISNADQHDWDADQHGDACDHCPHLASAPDPDGDGDGVGDACDPRPSQSGDARAIWLAFYDPSDITGWANTGNGGTWTVAGGMLDEARSGFALLDSPQTYADAYFATSLEVTTADTAEIGFCLSDIQPGLQYYCCCAANGGGTATARAASSWSTSGGQVSVPGTFTGGTANLAVGQHVEMTGFLQGGTFQCSIAQGAAVATPATAAADKVGTAVFYTTAPVRYRYAFVVTVPPL